MTGSGRRRDDHLVRLAERYGIETSYFTVNGEERLASDESLIAALRALGAEIESRDQAKTVLDQRRWDEWSRPVDPVQVVWGDAKPTVEVRLPPLQVGGTLTCTLYPEDGEPLQETLELKPFRAVGASRFGRESVIARAVELPWDVSPGYHRLVFENDEQQFETLLIAAPERAYAGADDAIWGVFLPLHAIQSEENWGAGSYSDLERLFTWVRELGGELVGTLPLLPTFLDEPFDPSPYSPVSRRFWNEFYIDIAQVPELETSDAARQIVESADFQRAIHDLRAGGLVDYREGMQVRRRVLEELSQALLSGDGERRQAFEAWLESRPLAREYARFRAAVEAQRTSFYEWPDHMRRGELTQDDVDPATEHYYLYAQWLASEQIEALADRVRKGGSGLYLDLPLGTHGAGFDVWKEPDLFAKGVAIGAPPDPLHEGGQNWGFPPMKPDAMRDQQYRHLIGVLRHHMGLAGTLRIDHVMGLHRQFWIPEGMDGADGVYVTYPAEELYAILALESHRNKTLIIGEDLGTVPDYVRPMMERHNLYRMIVLPFALSREQESLIELPPNAMASLNTHDIPPFATFWNQADDGLREALVGRLRETGYLEGDAGVGAVADAVTAYLAASPAKILMINAEDLWQETESQNVPGTTDEHPNWRRKARRSLEEITEDSHIQSVLQRVDALRESAAATSNHDSNAEGGQIGD